MPLESSIPTPQIELELTRIWNTIERKNKMRSSLFNLILYAENEERGKYLEEIAKKVIEKFPSRVILILGENKSPEEYLKAKVAVLSASKETYEISCDMIKLHVAGKTQEKKIPFVILPHVLTDLPIYLVWGEDPSEVHSLAASLEKLATRIIYDSESTANLPAFATALLEKKKTTNNDIADLNWARIENWRQLLTATFHSSEKLPYLKGTKKIVIHYNGTISPQFCHTQLQSIYLGSWIASQMKWTRQSIVRKDNILTFSYLADDRPITIELIADSYPSLFPGRIFSFELTTKENESMRFIRNEKKPEQVQIKIESREKCEIPTQYIFSKVESGQSLVNEICHKGTSAHYLNMLKTLSTIEGSTLC